MSEVLTPALLGASLATLAAGAAMLLYARRLIRRSRIEDLAREGRLVLVPVAAKLAEELARGWSRTVQIRLREHADPLFYDLEAREPVDEPVPFPEETAG